MSVKSKKLAESELYYPLEDTSTLWKEWSDTELNNENWATPKNGPDGLFLDTQTVLLPSSLDAHDWKRAKDLTHLTEPLTVFTANLEYPDLIKNNKHLLHSEFVRWFISTLINLQYCGRDGLEIIGENDNFIWSGRHQPWQGWMHVYSMNKAGKGVQHRPAVNPNGKYIVRLYFLGCWRRVLVDDLIPVNIEGIPLLPCSTKNNELWPMLLAKALLKLASLTWSQQREIVDFHPVCCLTGWVCLRLDVGYLSPQDKWDFLTKYAEHFEWLPETTADEKIRFNGSQTGTPRSQTKTEGKKSRSKVRTKAPKKQSDRALRIPSDPQPVTLFLGIEDMKELTSDAVPGLTPCWSHFVYVAQSRDIPIDPKDVKPPLPKWKLFRWLKWSIDKGLIDAAEYFVPIRSLKIVSPLKECKESLINIYEYANVPEPQIHQNEDTETTPKETGRKKKRRNASSESNKKKIKEEPPPDISIWGDFNKMEPHIKDIHFFYKLGYFQYTAKISDTLPINQLNDKKLDSKKDSKKGSKKGSRKSSPSNATSQKEPDFTDTINWPQKTRTRNEPLYLFTDSIENKFFLINFSTFQPKIQPLIVSTEKDDEPIVKQVREDCLVIEKYSWLYRPKKANALVSIATAGTKSTVMELEPGRHLLRIFCRSKANCFATVSSDTIFRLGDRLTMHQLMTSESDRIDIVAKHISNTVSNAYRSFGTKDYPEALKNYYKSYIPSLEKIRVSEKILLSHIHEYFINEKVHLIKKSLPEENIRDVLRSLRIFFLKRNIGLERHTLSLLLKTLRKFTKAQVFRRPAPSDEEKLGDKDVLNENRAASVIQAFFKMLLIQKYKRIHDPKHEQHDQVLRSLMIVAELFNYSERESIAHPLLRRIVKRDDRLYKMYPWSSDLEHVLQVQELRGTLLNVRPNQWLPIARFTINPGESESVLAAMDVFVNLQVVPRCSLRVFNNETGQEVVRLVNNVAPTRYRYSKPGHTVFAYGWSGDLRLREVDWTIHLISMKGDPMFHLLDDLEPLSSQSEIPNLVVEELFDTYIPNSKYYISRWILRVSRTCFASFRLRTTYGKVEIRFRIVDDLGRILAQVEGRSIVILPVVCLELYREASWVDFQGSRKDDGSINDGHGEFEDVKTSRITISESSKTGEKAVYYAEAFVLDESWPLTESEWAVVADAKTKVTDSFLKPKSSSASGGSKMSRFEFHRSKKGSKQSVESSQLSDPPYWVLQMVTDSGSGLEIAQDRTREREIAQMKESWAKENPGSLQRGKELRAAFISKHAISPVVSEPKKSHSSIDKSMKRETSRKGVVSVPIIQKIETRTLKPPQTHQKLPPLDLSTYVVKHEEVDTPWVKTDQEEEAVRSQRELNAYEANEDYSNFLENVTGILRRRRRKYRALFGDYKDSFWERRARLEEVYEARREYIANTKPPSVISKPSKTKSSGRDRRT